MTKSNRGSVVMTTIQAPTASVKQFAALQEWDLIVVGDLKTPEPWQLGGSSYYGPDVQHSDWPALSNAIPWNSYARKNLSYLYAIEDGAELIAESDDDNAPLAEWSEEILPRKALLSAIRGPEVANVFAYFSDDHVWPRGFPLDRVRSRTPLLFNPPVEHLILVTQFLVAGDPDVDAIFRLTSSVSPIFIKKTPVVLAPGVFAPFNSQNTIWRREVAPLLYLPSNVTFRFTDILRGWIAQRCVWEVGGCIALGGPTVVSDRNIHDLLVDFESEIPAYLHAEEIIRLLTDIHLSGEVSSDLVRCYEACINAGMVPPEELQIVHEWLTTLERVL